MVIKKEMEWGGRTLSIEVGKVAKQADGAAWVQYADTIVLATVVSERKRGDNTDFFPLTVDYREKMYAGGRIPGGFFKREARPHEKEVLTARLTDRPLRPLFPKGYFYETQVLISVISHDGENEADILGAIGASTALVTSDIPFAEPVASVKVGRIKGEFVLNPTIPQTEETDLDILIAGTKDAITMVEGEGDGIDESVFMDALEFGHEAIKQVVELQETIAKEIGIAKREWDPLVVTDEIAAAVKKSAESRISEIIVIQDKKERKTAQKELKEELKEKFAEEFPEQEKLIVWALEAEIKDAMRKMVLEKKVRLDGRDSKEIRQITAEVGLLPRAHGSSLFTRGQTQALGTCTLGAKMDEQRIDDLEGNYWKTFMLHYNFPPFCTGEVKRFLGTGRREQGHGHLAERSIKSLLPQWETFPYTVRIVSEILESNGSSSMASVCAASLAAMDAGVPLKSAVAGIAMGLIKEGDDYAILSDILGDEDHLGDMDFKVAGSKDGITAFQMDIKVKGLPKQIMAEALAQAKEGREHILGIMNQCMDTSRETVSPFAPRISHVQVAPESIGIIIGPGGRQIRKLQEDYSVSIDIDDDGNVCISSSTDEDTANVIKLIKMMTTEPEVGSTWDAKVVKIMDFGAFVELFPGKEGLVHISELEWRRVDKVEDVLKMGDPVQVKLIGINDQGKLDLSRKALLPKPEGYVERPPRKPSGGGGGNRFNKGNRGPRR
ncbi:MAG: polyribonucleotide nucleotidyltransferase [Candidatus Electryonea clarkiae]|nr:polyribonucleotide nucleotidyltransferase [Candidatus Electryonea clarkiae]MDP8286610.1 polyribonucleotide nucleotidyltransferase [Candidatus Electryonea clarkiae]